MGTHINFNNSVSDAYGGDGSNQRKPMGSVLPLVRQSSVYSLTFDELQNTLLGGSGRDFGSMNMDELLKNIWTAEETQAVTASVAVAQPSGCVSGGTLQRQGSLTLPRTLSQKTVDEVWKKFASKDSNGNIGSSCGDGSNVPGRQQTLGEMTLEDFLFRAGVVKEDNCSQQIDQLDENNSGFYANNGPGLAFGFGQPNQNSISFDGNNNSMILNQSPGLGLKMGATMHQQQLHQPQQQQQQPQQLQQQQQSQQQHQQHQQQQSHQRLPPTIFPKQTNVTFASPMNMVNKSSYEAAADGPVNSNNGLATMGAAGVTVAATSSGTSSAENNTWSPVPYVFGRGRKSNTGLEKVIERRQKRMIKNRESAARSRARKQAYTLELEAEIENLKQLNTELQRKQTEIMKTQKSELKETSKRPRLAKRQCLRRTVTGPW